MCILCKEKLINQLPVNWGTTVFDDNIDHLRIFFMVTLLILYYTDWCRDPRGFAIKFYTEDGIWDLVGNNTPIFFLRDPILFPLFIHSQKRNPATHLKVITKCMFIRFSISINNGFKVLHICVDLSLC